MIEAMKQALEVIEAAIKAGDWKVDGACDPDMAIHGLRQAIAKAEKHKCIYPDCSYPCLDLPDCMDAKKQEPVAYGDATTLGYVQTGLMRRASVVSKEEACLDGDNPDVPVYLHPQPKREPLTDEQIDHITAAFPTWLFPVENQRRDCDRAIARAIEAAHGIKGEA